LIKKFGVEIIVTQNYHHNKNKHQEEVEDDGYETIFPRNQCANCVSFNENKGHVAIGSQAGKVSIRTSIKELNRRLFNDIIIDYQQCQVTELQFSGNFLAVGTSKGDIHFLNVEKSYRLYKTVLGAFTTAVKTIDWDKDSKFIQISSKGVEYGFVDAEKGRTVDGKAFLY
jgi:WD40 repeat protein